MNVETGRILLESVEVVPVELHTNAKVEELLEGAEMTDEELAEARDAWGL